MDTNCQCYTSTRCNYGEVVVRGMKTIRNFEITGSINVYKCDMKIYAKECCINTYYVSSSNASMLGSNEREQVLRNIKTKTPKYIWDNNQYIKVFQLIEVPRTIIKPYINMDVVITRNIWFNTNSIQTELLTLTQMNKKIKEQQQASIDVEMEDAEHQPVDTNNIQYVYLIRDRTAVVANLPIYKIGKTTQKNFDRFKSYPKGFEIIMLIACKNCHSSECDIINLFKTKYRHVCEYGNEYFEGDYTTMMDDIYNIAKC